jgi:putative copper export protein
LPQSGEHAARFANVPLFVLATVLMVVVVMMVMMVTADKGPERRRYKDPVVMMMVMVVVMMAVLSQLHARANNSAPSVVRLQGRDSIWDWGK